MRKVERLMLGAVCIIVGAILLPVEILVNSVCSILDWIGGVVYAFTGDNRLSDKMAQYYEGTAKILRSKPLG